MRAAVAAAAAGLDHAGDGGEGPKETMEAECSPSHASSLVTTAWMESPWVA